VLTLAFSIFCFVMNPFFFIKLEEASVRKNKSF
jgi:hypothetical protein